MDKHRDLAVCTNQVMTFFRHLDDRDYDALTALLTDTATWDRQGTLLQGRQQVHDAMMKRPPAMRIHHLMTNLMADHLDSTACHMRAYMAVVRHLSDDVLVGPAPLAGIESIRTTHIELRQVGNDWLIHAMRNDAPSFVAAA